MDIMERKVKHLEFIQSGISRMNQCSFQMKGWAITVVSALIALFAASVDKDTGKGNSIYFFVAIFPTFIFWVLDSYYLQQERKFRAVYNDITHDLEQTIIDEFSIPLLNYKGKKYNLLCVMFSKTEWLLYISIIIGLLIAGFCV